MDNEQIFGQLARYKEVIIAIKKHTGLKSVRLIAEKMNYSRGETISEYGSLKHYKPKKFRDFVYLLAKVFNINPDYILKGEGPIFLVKSEELAPLEDIMTPEELSQKIEGLEYSRAVLEGQLRKLKEQKAARDESTGPEKSPRK